MWMGQVSLGKKRKVGVQVLPDTYDVPVLGYLHVHLGA